MPIDLLTPGQKLNNQELCECFGCSPQGGMRRAHKTNTLVLVSNHVNNIYDDRWEKGVLHYTGMGSTGHQTLEGNQNKTLAESATNGVTVHLFEVFNTAEYTYAGVVELAGNYYQETQPDTNGVMRQVYVFPLRLVSGTQLVVNEVEQGVYQSEASLASRLTNKELQQRALEGKTKPEKYQQTTTQYERNEWVVEYAKRIANGICQLCEEPAPFNKVNGEPYLETHHILWLSRGGSDTIDNTVALCPNCHAKMHIVDDEQDIQFLQQRNSNFR